MDALFVGLDLGTTLCKAAAYELDGTQRAAAQKTINTTRPQPGWAEQNPLEWVAAVQTVLRGLSTQLGTEVQRVKAIGVSSHGPSVIATDKNFRPLSTAAIWQDQRAADLCPDLLKRIGNSWVGLGMPESSFAVKLFWEMRENPELINQAAYLFDVKGFLLASLTGKAVDETSSSPGGRDWSKEAFVQMGVDVRKFPTTVPSLSVIGEILPSLAAEIDFPSHVLVVAGLNDGAAATLGAGVTQVGQGIVSLSTNGVMRTVVSRRVPGEVLIDNSLFCYSFIDGNYVTGGTTKSGGDSVRWFADVFLGGYAGDGIYEQISREAAESPIGANGVLFMPYLMGMGSPHCQKESQGSFLNLGRHHNRSDLTRALLEGVAFSLKDIGVAFDRLGWPWENLRFTGGGANNPTWRQIVANVLGKPLTGVRADSVMGAAMMAAAGGGQAASVSDLVNQWVLRTFEVEPQPESVSRYAEIYETYIQARSCLSSLSSGVSS